MSVQATIEELIREKLNPSVLIVENESHQHSGPATESHFKLTVVSEEFASLNRVQRHQRLYQLLTQQMQNGVHALALHLFTPEEWETDGHMVPASPDCRGGSGR